MAQQDHHIHSHHHTGNIRSAFLLNTVFALIEIAGGFYTNSVAILSDALHDLGDSLSLALSWYFQKKSQRLGDRKFSYGYQRFSLVGALLTAIVLIVGSVFILIEAIGRISSPEPSDSRGMLLLALLGVAFNLVAMLRLKRGSSLNEEMVSLHFLEDVLGWVAVLCGSVVMLIWDVPVLDPILSVLISGYVLTNVYKSLQKVFRILLQGVPVGVSEDEIRRELGQLENVQELHHVHIWSMDGTFNIMTLHAVVNPGLTDREQEQLKATLRDRLRALNIQHATIELETSERNRNQCDL